MSHTQATEPDLSGLRLELVGARLLGPAPIDDLWVPFTPGVHALYGKNGAGKSRILMALADLLEGVPSDSYLVAQVVPRDPRDHDGSPWDIDLNPYDRRPSAPHPSRMPWHNPGRSPWERRLGDLLWPICRDSCSAETFDFYAEHDHPSDSSVLPEEEEYLWARLDEIQNLDELSEWESRQMEDLDRLDGMEDETEELTIGRDEDHITGLIGELVAQHLVALSPKEWGWDLAPAVRWDRSDRYLSTEFEHLLSDDDDTTPVFLREMVEGQGPAPEDTVIEALSRFDAVGTWENEADRLGHEPDIRKLLARSPMVPFRLGGSHAFSDLQLIPHAAGPAVRVVRSDKLGVQELTATTRRRLFYDVHGARMFNSQGGLSGELTVALAQVSTFTTDVYRRLLIDSPELAIDAGPPAEWLVAEPLAWRARDISGVPLPLNALSEAQKRWALTAIAIAETMIEEPVRMAAEPAAFAGLPVGSPPAWVMLDEPDAALHATAQRHAVEGLVDLAVEANAIVMVSTHSREFLGHPDVTLHHVHREAAGHAVTRRLDAVARRDLPDLGLDLPDLLLLQRIFLVVEGSHDQVVLDALIGDELRHMGVYLLPMRGGRNLATTVESTVFAHLSDTPVVAALDNLRGRQVAAYWESLVSSRAGGQVAFDVITKEHFSSKERTEEIFLIDYCRAAAELGQIDRFRVFGFSKPDIPMYLPVAAVVPGASSWGTLWSEFQAQSKQTSFKPWLKNRYGVEIDEALLRRAAESLDHIPDDFSALLETCRNALRPRRRRRRPNPS